MISKNANHRKITGKSPETDRKLTVSSGESSVHLLMHQRTNSTCSQEEDYHQRVEKQKKKLVRDINIAFHMIDEAVGDAVKSMVRIGNDLFEYEVPPPEPNDYPEVIPVFEDSDTYTETYTTSPESYTLTEGSAPVTEGSALTTDVSELEESQ